MRLINSRQSSASYLTRILLSSEEKYDSFVEVEVEVEVELEVKVEVEVELEVEVEARPICRADDDTAEEEEEGEEEEDGGERVGRVGVRL